MAVSQRTIPSNRTRLKMPFPQPFYIFCTPSNHLVIIVDVSVSDPSNPDRSSETGNDNLCPFCEEPLPSEPSEKLDRMKASLLALPNAMSLLFPQTGSFCELHRAEQVHIPFGIREGWPTAIDFKLLETRIEKHTDHLFKIAKGQTPSCFLNIAQNKWKSQGKYMFSMAGEFDGFEVQQPGYYGPTGLEVMFKALTKSFCSEGSKTPLDDIKLAPFSFDYFLRCVLVPELALLLIAEDLDLPTSDPKVMNTLESSRVFGTAVFPTDEEAFDPVDKSQHSSPPPQAILKPLPDFVVPYIDSSFDPPNSGNCGYYAIAASIGKYSEESYLDVRSQLLREVSKHAKDHEQLIYSTTSTRTRRTPTFGAEVVKDLLFRLDYKEVKCSRQYWMQMPYLGYAIASAYNRPTILLDPKKGNCNTFFPYRTLPDSFEQQDPIVLAFVNQEHFVSLGVNNQLPFPGVFGMDRNAAMLGTTNIPLWIKAYQDQLDMWPNQKSVLVKQVVKFVE